MSHPGKGGRDSILIRRTPTQTDETIPQWQTIYCSLMLLLVVFFVMLIAYSSIDQDRFMQKKYVQKAIHNVSTQVPDMNQAMRSLQQLAAGTEMKSDFTIMKTETGFKAVVPNPVLFDSGDASLNKSLYPVLDGIIAIAKKNDLHVQIEGHTDNIPVETAKYPSNWELSTLRAVNILRYFQNSGGIPPDRLSAVGFAEHRPVANNDTPKGRQKNRRIEILFRSKT
jgi:chemotaxis protein MotB